VTACLELAAAERNPYSSESVAFRLLEGAVRMFDTAAVEPTRQFLLHLPAGWDRRVRYERDLRGSLVAACTLTGERFPEYDKWRREEIEATAAANRRLAGLEPMLPLDPYTTEKPEPPPDTIVGKAVAGRNDPCPCGSGKKFKKCCGK
jgi:SEC-C motif